MNAHLSNTTHFARAVLLLTCAVLIACSEQQSATDLLPGSRGTAQSGAPAGSDISAGSESPAGSEGPAGSGSTAETGGSTDGGASAEAGGSAQGGTAEETSPPTGSGTSVATGSPAGGGALAGSGNSAASTGVQQGRAMKHPGAPLTLSDLQTLKAYVDQGKEPWKSGFNQLANSPTSRLSYAGRGGPFAKVSRAPDENLNAWRSDMVAIWDLSRMWYFTRDERYAKTASWLLLGWANTQTEFSGRESMLDLGDYAYQFVGGADILRSTWPGWTEADT
ncbi:MAG: hypothetical protein ACJ8GJ_21320, partial [Vitreoscilla sp.]